MIRKDPTQMVKPLASSLDILHINIQALELFVLASFTKIKRNLLYNTNENERERERERERKQENKSIKENILFIKREEEVTKVDFPHSA